ncbi:MAG: S8 family serine peptidase, partial [Sphaerochaetaceae bacterium]|nr:S8 family serine peptidase [Sphaerochaetaceae bacterium]
LSVSGEGSVIKRPDQVTYREGTQVTLTAEPATGHDFTGWYTGSVLVTSDNPYTFTIAQDVSLKAGFSPFLIDYSLTASWMSASADASLTLTSVPEPSVTDVTTRSLPRVKIASYDKDLPDTQTDRSRIIVRYEVQDSDVRTQHSPFASFGTVSQLNLSGESTQQAALIHLDTASVRSLSSSDTLEQVRKIEGVLWAEYDRIYTIHAGVNDPLYGFQWNFEALDMPLVWESQGGDPSVTVAVIDTGIQRSLTDFETTEILSGYNTIDNSNDVYDGNGHGTHVAGTVAQSTNNKYGVAGMAYGVTLLPIKALGDDGSGYSSDVAEAIEYAVEAGAQVINMSLGGDFSQAIADAAAYAVDQGSIIVASTGNENEGTILYPAAYEGVIAVGATGYSDERAPYSNYGEGIDVVAPGGDLLTTFLVDGYGEYPAGIYQEVDTPDDEDSAAFYGYQGTSMAAPHVSALAALLLSRNPNLTGAQVYDRITSQAEDLGEPGYDTLYGYGLIDPLASLQLTWYPLSDTVSSSISDSHSWAFTASTGTVSAALTSVEVSLLSLTLKNEAGTVLAEGTAGESGITLSYDVPESTQGTYQLTVSRD